MLDPSLKEAAAAAGALTVVATTHGEVCALHKPGGVGVSLSQVRAKPGAASRAVCCSASSPWSPSDGLCVPLTCGRYCLKLSKLQRVHTHAGMMPGHVICMRSVTARLAKPRCCGRQTMRLVRVACGKAAEVAEGLRAALKGHETARVARRVRRHGGAGGAAGPVVGDAAGAVAVLPAPGDPGAPPLR